jgi:DNA-directed RNA polymerase subunit RPC12/RpoP
MADELFGYEWSYTCVSCEEKINLSGMMGEVALINGEKEYRARSLGDGDTIQCPTCGTTVKLEVTQV